MSTFSLEISPLTTTDSDDELVEFTLNIDNSPASHGYGNNTIMYHPQYYQHMWYPYNIVDHQLSQQSMVIHPINTTATHIIEDQQIVKPLSKLTVLKTKQTPKPTPVKKQQRAATPYPHRASVPVTAIRHNPSSSSSSTSSSLMVNSSNGLNQTKKKKNPPTIVGRPLWSSHFSGVNSPNNDTNKCPLAFPKLPSLKSHTSKSTSPAPQSSINTLKKPTRQLSTTTIVDSSLKKNVLHSPSIVQYTLLATMSSICNNDCNTHK